jgi:hypothetical protein
MNGDPILGEIQGLVPKDVRDLSGAVLYSGREAWSGDSPLYLMGINPGGDPRLEKRTVSEQVEQVLSANPANWSAYRDDSWANGTRPPGTSGMQPRVLHLFERLALDPSTVPASNLVFVRSRREGDIGSLQMRTWAELCWPFHKAIIQKLGVRVIVCFGATVSDFVRSKVGAHEKVDHFVETNSRRWASQTFQSPSQLRVVHVTHPSIANWCNPVTDPSELVVRALG